MKETYVLRQSDSLVFNVESETFTFTARRLTDAKRRAIRKKFHEDSIYGSKMRTAMLSALSAAVANGKTNYSAGRVRP